MAKVTIFNPALELRRLEDKIANSKEEKICVSWLLVPRSACKEAKWDEDALVEEAIERGKRRREGEVLEAPSWEELERERDEAEQLVHLTTHEDVENLGLLPRSSKVLSGEATEEEQRKPGRVFNLLGDLGTEEPGEQEEVHEEGSEVQRLIDEGCLFHAGCKCKRCEEQPEFISISRPQDFEQLWDCPMCDDVIHVSTFVCPHCSFDRNNVEQAIMEFYMSKDNSLLEPKEHVAYLNGLIMLKTGNPNWHKLVIGYMEKYSLKPEDMEGLFGPKPWEEAIMSDEPHGMHAIEDHLSNELAEEEVPATTEELTMEKALRTKAEHKAEHVEASAADIKAAFEEKVTEIADSDPRTRVIVSDEVGWICEDCNRVWSLDLKHCTVCNKEYAAEIKDKEEEVAKKSKSDLDVLKEKLELLGTTLEVKKDDSLYEEVKTMEGMKTAEKARLMLLLKEKEKDGGSEDKVEGDPEVESPSPEPAIL